MSEFKARADLRTEQIKKILLELESKRDELLDELAFKRGEASRLEYTIKRCYELILDVNKEEQHKEAEELAHKIQRTEEQKSVDGPAKSIKGIKTPRRNKK